MTNRFGLLGERLGHSFSPRIHAVLGCGDYGLYEVPPEKLAEFLETTPLEGMNVTIPYKKAVVPLCASLSPAAERLGSVNTLRRTGTGWHGDNTDYAGFRYMLSSLGFDPAGEKTVVFGTGGAAVTACAVLRDLGAAEATAISRTGPENYGNLDRHRDARLVVNATPVGMYPENGKAAASLRSFPECRAVLDLIYNPARTALLLEAEELGIPCRNGLGMLAAQAYGSEEVFLGRSLPEDLIEKAAESVRKTTENLILIGMPGCGKTRLGKLLARELGRPFLDADEELTRQAGRTPEEIIRQEGEAAFRDLETRVLAELGKGSGAVIATGGGCVTRPENRNLLRQNGRIFWLRRDLSKLPVSNRPLSQSVGPEELYRRRKDLYAAFADHQIENNGGPRAALREILEQWEKSC